MKDILEKIKEQLSAAVNSGDWKGASMWAAIYEKVQELAERD